MVVEVRAYEETKASGAKDRKQEESKSKQGCREEKPGRTTVETCDCCTL